MNILQQVPGRYTYDSDTKYKIFVTLWAIATLFHMGPKEEFTTGFHFFLLTVSAIMLLNAEAGKPTYIELNGMLDHELLVLI